MKKLFLFLLISLSMKSQNKVSDELNRQVVNAEASIIIPIGQLANKFDFAQSYGLWFNLGKVNGWHANVELIQFY